MTFTNHQGMSVDLLAKLANSGDKKKLQVINSLLTNVTENLFNQKSVANVNTYGEGTLACGSVIEAAVKNLWGNGVMTYYSYHKPITLDSNEATLGWDKITYDSKYLANNRKVIKNKLTSGIPVRVGAVYDPKPGMLAANKALQPTHSGGHFLLIVGCNDSATKFLYIDPFPGGSILKYTGGYVSKSYEGAGFSVSLSSKRTLIFTLPKASTIAGPLLGKARPRVGLSKILKLWPVPLGRLFKTDPRAAHEFHSQTLCRRPHSATSSRRASL